MRNMPSNLCICAVAATLAGCSATAYRHTLEDTTQALAVVRGGLTDAYALRDRVCPKERASEACTVVRRLSEAADNSYQLAALATQTADDAQPAIEKALDLVRALVTAVTQLGTKEMVANPELPPLSFVVPGNRGVNEPLFPADMAAGLPLPKQDATAAHDVDAETVANPYRPVPGTRLE